jgi:hypothetical protein
VYFGPYFYRQTERTHILNDLRRLYDSHLRQLEKQSDPSLPALDWYDRLIAATPPPRPLPWLYFKRMPLDTQEQRAWEFHFDETYSQRLGEWPNCPLAMHESANEELAFLHGTGLFHDLVLMRRSGIDDYAVVGTTVIGTPDEPLMWWTPIVRAGLQRLAADKQLLDNWQRR